MRPALLSSFPAGSIEGATVPAALPENWYILASSREVRRGKVVARTIGDRGLVLFRAESGKLAAFEAHCAHMGCHLRHGTVVGERLRCALHFREIEGSGKFLRPDGAPSARLVQPSYPVVEKYGAIFVYVGGTPRFPLPSLDILDEADLLAQPAGEYRTKTPWYALVANGCDMEHLAAVHGRDLKEPPVVSRPDAWSFRIAYRTAVTGKTPADRIMRKMSGNSIRASLTAIGGTTMLVQSLAGPRPSIFLFSMCPEPDGGTRVRGVVGLAGRAKNPLDRLKLRAARWLFLSFLRKDLRVLEGLEWHPPVDLLTSGDRTTRKLFEYFHELPAAPTAKPRGMPLLGPA